MSCRAIINFKTSQIHCLHSNAELIQHTVEINIYPWALRPFMQQIMSFSLFTCHRTKLCSFFISCWLQISRINIKLHDGLMFSCDLLHIFPHTTNCVSSIHVLKLLANRKIVQKARKQEIKNKKQWYFLLSSHARALSDILFAASSFINRSGELFRSTYHTLPSIHSQFLCLSPHKSTLKHRLKHRHSAHLHITSNSVWNAALEKCKTANKSILNVSTGTIYIYIF